MSCSTFDAMHDRKSDVKDQVAAPAAAAVRKMSARSVTTAVADTNRNPRYDRRLTAKQLHLALPQVVCHGFEGGPALSSSEVRPTGRRWRY